MKKSPVWFICWVYVHKSTVSENHYRIATFIHTLYDIYTYSILHDKVPLIYSADLIACILASVKWTLIRVVHEKRPIIISLIILTRNTLLYIAHQISLELVWYSTDKKITYHDMSMQPHSIQPLPSFKEARLLFLSFFTSVVHYQHFLCCQVIIVSTASYRGVSSITKSLISL